MSRANSKPKKPEQLEPEKLEIDKLHDECDAYLMHLETEIALHSKNSSIRSSIPGKLVVGQYDQIRDVLIREMNPTISLKEGDIIHYGNNKTFDNFNLLLQKHQIVSELRKSGDEMKFIMILEREIPNSEKTNLDILKSHRDSKAVRFLKNIGHILTAGIVSKFTKNSFFFWRSRGAVFSKRVEKIMKSIEAGQDIMKHLDFIPSPPERSTGRYQRGQVVSIINNSKLYEADYNRFNQ